MSCEEPQASPQPGPRRNIELKARLAGLDAARKIAEQLATGRLGTQHQIDTYFYCPHGRLKLRQIDGLSAQLVAYQRSDDTRPKASDYRLVPVSNPETLKQALAAALGLRVVVEKVREIYLSENVRIHLDQVTGLGTFLEFEAVLSADQSDRDGHEKLHRLGEQFALAPADLVSGSYSDLLEAAQR